MNVQELPTQLKSGFSPVYLIVGPEDYFRTEALRFLREKAQADGYDIKEVDAMELDARKFFDDLRTPSLFAPSRMVLVDHSEALIGAPLRLLTQYAAAPSRKTILVLAAEELKAKAKRGRGKKKEAEEDTSAKDISALLKKSTVVECPLLNKRDLPSWCVARAKAFGKKMDSYAAAALVELAGSNLGQLNGQIQSLASFVRERANISRDDVTRLVGGDHMRSIWEMMDGVRDRRPAVALRALDRLLRDGEISATGIITNLANEVRKVITLKQLQAQNMPQAEIARITHVQPWLVEKMLRTNQNLSIAQLRNQMRLLVKADLHCKTGAGDEDWVLQKLLMEFCGTR